MDKKSTNPKQETKPWRINIPLILFLAFVLIMVFVPNFYPSPAEITWKEFEKNMLNRNAIDQIVIINGETAEVYIKKEFSADSTFSEILKSPIGGGINPGPHYTFNIGSVESFEHKLELAQQHILPEAHPVVRYKDRNTFVDFLPWIVPLLFFFFMYRILFRGRVGEEPGAGGTSMFSFGRSTARLLENDKKSEVTFEDVAGLAEAKAEVKEIVEFLKEANRFTKLGAKIPKGVIIVGPPGTGKTLLAKAVAGEAKVPFFSLSGSEFVEMFVGVGASRVRDLFKRAKEKAPCIVFIDEIDAVGRSRGRNALSTGSNDERESTLNQLLTEMDGFGTNSGVIVLAATNRADILDPALLRPGRFDRHIYLELPSMTERKEIFKVHLKPLVIEGNVDVSFLASQTPGFSGADIANICNEAALIAARKKKEKVERPDFLDAIDRIVAGIEKKSKIISKQEKRIIAYHEAGHTIASWFLKYIDPLVKVSIIPRGKSLGAAWYLPEERQLRTYNQLAQHITATLAGRAAEEVIFGETSSGAVDDLEKVTKEAYSMVAFFGFNKKIGNVSFYDSTGRSDMALQKPYSEETGKIIDEEVRKLIENCYEDAKALLIEHKEELISIAELLLKREILFKDEIEAVLGKQAATMSAELIEITP